MATNDTAGTVLLSADPGSLPLRGPGFGLSGLVGLSALMGLALCGCASSSEEGESGPVIEALSTTSAAVGDEVRFYGTDFVTSDSGWVDVTFRGDYVTQDGAREAIDLTVALRAENENEVVWPDFGGYRIPFAASGAKIGRFEGHVFATNRYFDGTYTTQDGTSWSLVRFEVEPSVVVLDFRGVGDGWIADCKDPSPNAIQGVPYMLRARAVGFEATNFTFAVTAGLVVDGEVSRNANRFDGIAQNNEHAIGMVFGAVPYYKDGYRMSVAIEAQGTDGRQINVEYPFLVRRPVQPFFTTAMEIAEIYAPVQVSGCIPGGQSSISTTYNETTSETRTKTQGHEARSGWTRDYGTQHASTWGSAESVGGNETRSNTVTATDTSTTGGSVTTTDAFSSDTSRMRATTFNVTETDETTWNHAVGNESFGMTTQTGEGNVGAAIPGGIFSVGGSYSYARTAGGSDSDLITDGTRDGTDTSNGGSSSSSSSESESHSRAENEHWSESQSYAEANSFSAQQNWNSTASYSEGLTESENIGNSFAEAYTETVSVSSTESESLSVTSNVWAGEQGAWFRQTTRLVRRGVLVAYDLCGNGNEVGPVSVTDWAWAPDLATSEACPPAPNFPQAECRIPPCEGR